MTRSLGTFAGAVLAVAVVPLIVVADTGLPDASCHVPTQQEQTQLLDRGVPYSGMICQKEMAILGVGKNFEQWYAQLKSTSPCNRNTCTLTCRTRNTGAQVCGPVSRSWGSIGCHPVNNTAIFPSVAYGFAAHIELLRRYCGQQGRCTINSVVQKWAPASDGNNPSQYAAFVSRYSGVPQNQVFDPNDIDLMGRLAITMACMEAGSLPYDVNELKQGLVMAAGGQRQPAPGNVGQLLQESLQTPYASSQPAVGVRPLFAPSGAGAYLTTAPVGTPLPPPTVNPTANFSTNTLPQSQAAQGASAIPGQSTTPLPSSASPVPPAAIIIVQPRAAAPGGAITLSWASVGMRPDIPCTVTEDGQVIASKNSDSRAITIPEDAEGVINFALQCTPIQGEALQRAAGVFVQ